MTKNRHEIHIWTENRENTTILFFEDHGEGIQFYVYCYNNQPKIEINYQTGDSKEIASSSENEPKTIVKKEPLIVNKEFQRNFNEEEL